jgi:4-amino-4-deoxy-L-arabinose transferase-like glycosyltransferase
MLVFLPLLALVFLVIAFHRNRVGWAASSVYASIPWSLFLALITEALSQFRLLTRPCVALVWAVFAAVCFAWMWKSGTPAQARGDGERPIETLTRGDRAQLIGIAVIVFLVALTAVASAPNNWDAMEYHLPRVVEWISNRGVQFYPTIDWSQLNQAPFAEYAMLHIDLLSGSDRLLALVQWLAYLGCILGAALVAQELGGGRQARILAAVFTATIPSALLGASSTKNDCVGAYWILLAVYLLLRWGDRQDWPHALAIGSTLGLAVFTKGTAYVFLPCLVLACGIIWPRAARWNFLKRLPIIAAIGVLICAPLWVRNYKYTGSPMGFPYFYGVGDMNGRMFRTAHVTPALLAANVIRNLALQTEVPDDRINAFSSRVFTAAIQRLGVDPNDRGQIVASQLGYLPRFSVRFNPRNEVLSEEPIHLLLFLVAGVLFLIHRGRIGRQTGWYSLGVVGAFITYCALLRWSPWNARYQIPLFVLGSAVAAVVLAKTMPRWTANATAALVLLLAFPLALANDSRPLITRHGLRGSILTTPRDQTYFFDSHREFASSFIAAAKAARASTCRSIGIDANLLHFEYPMMAMLNEDGVSRQISYEDVENSSIQYAKPTAKPACMVICLQCLNDPEKMARYSARLPETQSFGAVVLFTQSASR